MNFAVSIPFAPVTCSEALARVDAYIADRDGQHFVCFCEANLFSHAVREHEVVTILEQASMVLADGVSVFSLANLTGQTLPERVPGPRFLLDCCEAGLERGYRHFFYGGAEGVPERLAERLRIRYPGINIVGTYSPPFRPLDDDEEQEIRAMIEAAKPDCLWVGLGGPKQERWMAARVGTIDVPVMFGVGAAFDFHSGNRPWAPSWIRRIGMEWLFRMLTGGWRTFRRNVVCLSIMAGVLVVGVFRRLLGRGGQREVSP